MRNRGFEAPEDAAKRSDAPPPPPPPQASSDVGAWTACPDESASSSDDEAAGDEPVVEIVETDARRAAPAGETARRARRPRVLIVFDGDKRTSRRPHKVLFTFPRDEARRAAVTSSDLVEAFCERYANLPAGPAPLRPEDAHLVDRLGNVVAPGDCLELYCSAPLKVRLGPAPGKPPAAAVVEWGYKASVVPERRPFFADKRVETLDCGWLHVVAATESGAVFAWGENAFGQLGTGDEAARPEPCRVALPGAIPKVGAVACGAHFTLAVTADNNLWSWGRYQASNWPTAFAASWRGAGAGNASP